jgi:Family of unknown function (DUF6171)
MDQLPGCEYRIELDKSDEYYCRHTQVHAHRNRVTATMCQSCTRRTEGCYSPRPIPDNFDQPYGIEPTLVQQVWSLSSSIASFVTDGMRLVDKGEYVERIAICDDCEFRIGNRCAKCGCNLTLKASAKVFECPMSKWGKSTK